MGMMFEPVVRLDNTVCELLVLLAHLGQAQHVIMVSREFEVTWWLRFRRGYVIRL